MNPNILNFQQLKDFTYAHKAFNHPFFNYINSPQRNGFSADQFEIYWHNYFFRTINTIPSVANVVKAAAAEGDMENLALAGKNLYEETGQANQENVHIKLLIDAYNTHAKVVFGLNSINLKTIPYSNRLIPEVKLFLETQKILYEHPIYDVVIGANYAQESAAPSMLANFYDAFFLQYRNHLSDADFAIVSKYFHEHLDGTEEQHALNAEKIVINRCNDPKNIPYILFGVEQFLNIQSQLWDGLHREILVNNNSRVISFIYQSIAI